MKSLQAGAPPQPVESEPTSPGARRQPIQRRSLETVERILAAASRLLQHGFTVENITTPQIAKEAGVSIGSLYRFFPDKQSIVDGIAVRRAQDLEQTVTASLAVAPDLSTGAEVIAHIIDTYVEFVEEHSDFAAIVHDGSHISAPIRQRHFGYDSDIAVLARRYLAEVLRVPDTPDHALRWRIVGALATPVLAFALRQPHGDERRKAFDEVKRLIVGYLFDDHGQRRPQGARRTSARR